METCRLHRLPYQRKAAAFEKYLTVLLAAHFATLHAAPLQSDTSGNPAWIYRYGATDFKNRIRLTRLRSFKSIHFCLKYASIGEHLPSMIGVPYTDDSPACIHSDITIIGMFFRNHIVRDASSGNTVRGRINSL